MGKSNPNPAYTIFGTAHLMWLIIPLIAIALLAAIFHKHKRQGKVAIYVLAAVMITLRVLKYFVFKTFIWDTGWKTVVPFELCTILSFLIPFTVFFKTKKLNPYIYPLAIIGGIVTLAYPEWIFNGRGLIFDKLESLIVHILLIAIPVFSAVTKKNFSFKIRDYYKPVLAMLILITYAYIANIYIYIRSKIELTIEYRCIILFHIINNK